MERYIEVVSKDYNAVIILDIESIVILIPDTKTVVLTNNIMLELDEESYNKIYDYMTTRAWVWKLIINLII